MCDENYNKKEALDEIKRLREKIVELEGRLRPQQVSASPTAGDSGGFPALETKGWDSLDQLLANLPLPVSIIDEQGRYVYVNSRFTQLFGYTLEDTPTGRDWFERAYPDPAAREEALALWKKDLSAMAPGMSRTRSFRVTCKDGSNREIIFRPVTMADGRQFVYYEDVTILRGLQEELIRDQKLEAGEFLAGGVAHHLNNVLTAIMGNLSLANHEKGLDRGVRELLADAERACVLAQDLAQNLMDYAAGPPLEIKPEEPDRILAAYCRPGGLPSEFKVIFDASPGLWPVLIDRRRAGKALADVIDNAVESMPSGGVIQVRAENLRLEGGADSPRLPAGTYLKISIHDHGVGIPPRHLGRVFDPFFTTKRKGKGMGLALALATIKRHGGDITVESRQGQGSTFTIILPAAESGRQGDLTDYSTSSGSALPVTKNQAA